MKRSKTRESMDLDSIKKIYAAYSDVYDGLFKRIFYPRIKHAITYMDIKSGDRVLDLGVGTGLSLPLYPHDCSVTGIDLSTEMLGKARDKISRDRLNHIELLEMDAMKLDFEDNSFDKVFISHVVSVVPDPNQVMSEVRRVCKTGGDVVIVNHFKSRNKVVSTVEKVINPICEKVGWKSDLCIDEFLSNSGLMIKEKYMLKRLDFWHIVFAVNDK